MDSTPHTSSPQNTSHPAVLCTTSASLVFLPFVYALIFLTALPGNALSLWVFLRGIAITSPTHIYLSHLSISNLLLSLTAPFLAAYYYWGTFWPMSGFLCQLVLHGITPVLHINIYISLMILTWVALSRFASLIQHTHASRPSACATMLPHGFFTCLTKASFAKRVCAAVWVLTAGWTIPVSIFYSVNEAMKGSNVAKELQVCYNPEVEMGGTLTAAFSVVAITMFFVCYLLVLLSYIAVLKHIGRSRRSTNVTTSQSLLSRVFRNIVVIQVVLSVCLLPYHIFKPIFNFLAHDPPTHSTVPDNHCHPLSTLIELKSCLLLLAALRGSTDPVMYFLLDKTFRYKTLSLLRCKTNKPQSSSVTGSVCQKAGKLGDGNAATVAVNSSHDSVL